MLEAQRVAQLIHDTLVADTGAGGVATLTSGHIYRELVPQGDGHLPAVVHNVQSAVDTNTIGGVRVWGEVLAQVRVIGAGLDYGPLNTIADRVDTVLQGIGGLKNGAVVTKLRRESVGAYTEVDGGAVYAHLSLIFRGEVRAA